MFSDGSDSVLPPPPQPLLGYPGGYPAPTHSAGSPAYLIPQPSTSRRLDLGNMKPVNSGSVIFSDAGARAWDIAAEQDVSYDMGRAKGSTVILLSSPLLWL